VVLPDPRREDALPDDVVVAASLADAIAAVRKLGEPSACGRLLHERIVLLPPPPHTRPTTPLRSIAEGIETVHIIGGATAFDEAVALGLADVLYVSEIASPEHDTDVGIAWPMGDDTPFRCTMRAVSSHSRMSATT